MVHRPHAHQRDITRLEYIPASSLNETVPRWVDAALARAVHKSPAHRAEALSALVEDLRRPNPDYRDEPRPLLERNPVAFWRGLSLALLALNLLLLYRLSH
jgi:hypothetical protein